MILHRVICRTDTDETLSISFRASLREPVVLTPPSVLVIGNVPQHVGKEATVSASPLFDNPKSVIKLHSDTLMVFS